MGTTLRLDPIRCDAYGMCAELLPELISPDDWGYPVIRPGGIPDHLLDHARRAADVCPVLALRLEDASTARRRPAGPMAQPADARLRAAARPPADARSRAGA